MESKAKIIAKTDELFRLYGVKSITMDEIACELGISKKTIYQYFKDKDELVYETTLYLLECDRKEFDDIQVQADNSIEELFLISKCLRRNFENLNPSILFDLKKYHPKAWDLFIEFKETFFKGTVRKSLERGMSEGYFRSEIDVDILTVLRLEQVQMSFDPRVFPRNQFDFKEVQIQFFDHFVNGILTDKGRTYYNELFNKKMSMAINLKRQLVNNTIMKRRTIYIIIFTALLQNIQAQDVQKFSLEEAVMYAHENNNDVKNAQLVHKSSDYEIGEILSIGLPQISASVNVTSNVVVPKTPVPGEFFGGEPGSFAFVAFSPKHQGNLNITLDQLIFDASYFLGLKAAKMLKELTYKDVQLSEIAATEVVSKAYYNALVQQQRVELFERQLNTIDTLLIETTLMLENGFAEKIDVSRIKVQYNNLKVEKQRFDEIAKLSYDILKFQMGFPIATPIELTENISDLEFIAPSIDMANFSYNNRLEFSRLKIHEDLQQVNIKNIRFGYYPNLQGSASVAGNAGSGSFGDVGSFDFGGANRTWFENASVGLTLNVPIFDSFKKHHQIQKIRVQLMQINNQYDQMRSSIDLEIAQARIDLNSGISNLAAQEENLELSKEIFDVSKVKYQEGVGSNIEVINATTTYKEAEINYYNALYDVLIAKVDLEKSLGTLNR